MFSVFQSDLPDVVLELWLVAMLGVTLVSSVAWLASRRMTDNPAIKHLVLFCGLLSCVAMPMLAWLFAAANVTLISVPVLGGEHGIEAPARVGSEEDYVDEHDVGAEREEVLAETVRSPEQADRTPSQLTRDEPSRKADFSSPQIATTADQPAAALVAAAATQSEPPRAPAAVAEYSAEADVSPRKVADGAMVLWAIGVALMLASLARNCVRLVQLRRSSQPATNKRVQRLLREVTDQLGVRRPVLLLFSNRAVAPLAFGLLREVVILPDRLLDSIDDDELRDVLIHEIAHLRRGDQRIVLVQELAAALYWPIVTVHGLNRELRRAREELCDNVVLASRDPIGYGETLLHVAQLLVQPRSMRTAVGIFGGPSELERRITGLIDPSRNTVTTVRRKTACVVACMFVAAGSMVSATRLATSAEAAQPSATPDGADAAQGRPTISTKSKVATNAAPAIENQQPEPDRDAVKRAGHFTGQVTGPDGGPVQGAKIYMVPYSGFRSTLWSGGGSVLLNPLESIGSVRARTDAQGRFEFDAPDMVYTTLEGLPATRQGLLMAAAEGYAADWIEKIRFRSDPPQLRKLDLQLSELGKPIRGRLLDPEGRPLVKARVQLTRVMIPERRNLDAHLAEVRARDGSLIEYLRDLEQPDLLPGIDAETWTDADGRFSLSGVGREWIAILKVEDPAVATTHFAVMMRDAPGVDTGGYYHGVAGEKPAGLKADADTRGDQQGPEGGVIYGSSFTYQLKPGRTIRGRVVDRDTRKGIAGMWVGPVQNYRAGVSSRLYPWTTDEEGRFTITGLPQKMPQEDEVVMAVAPPGVPYQMAGEWITGNEDILIKCPRGIPFQLKVVDEQGQPLNAEVTYIDVQPNPHVQTRIPRPEARYHWPFAPAARRADGTYEGFVMPGPGAVLINLPEVAGYRPAHVDPKAFFAPRRTEWTEHDEWAYGTDDTLTTSNEERRIFQHEYEAIVLVNPAPGSEPLELSATVFKDRPRHVYFVDEQGNPVHNITWTRYGQQYFTHQLPLRGLHPDRLRPLTYYQEDRRMIGYLLARGDDDAPYTVRMQRWATITGRVVDENGNALTGTSRISAVGDHPADAARQLSAKTDENGRFTIGKLIPGHHYTGKVLRGDHNIRGRLVPLFAGMAFEDVVLRPGEIRDLGDIRTSPPTYEEFPLDYQD